MKNEFKTPYYIPIHTINAFKERVDNKMSTLEIRNLIQLQLQDSKYICKRKLKNGQLSEIHRLKHNKTVFYVPIIEDETNKINTWKVIPTIMLEGMSFGKRNYNKEVVK